MSEHWISNFFTSRTQNWHRLDHRSLIWQSFWNVRRPNSHTFWRSVTYERHYCENNPLTDSWGSSDMDKQSIMSCWIRRTLLSKLSENRGYMFCTLHPVLIFFVSVSLWEYAVQTDWTLNQSGLSAQGRASMSNLQNLILCWSRLGRAFNQRPILEGGGADSGQKYIWFLSR